MRVNRHWAYPHARFMDLAEVIVVIGGCDRKGLLKLPFTDAYHPESRRWTPLPSLPGYTRSEFAACALRNDIYVSGEGRAAAGAPQDWLFASLKPLSFSLQPRGGGGIFPNNLQLLAEVVCSPAGPVTGMTLTFFQQYPLQFVLLLVTSLSLANCVQNIMLHSLHYSISPTTPFYREVKNFPIISKMVKLGETQIGLIPMDCVLPEVQALEGE